MTAPAKDLDLMAIAEAADRGDPIPEPTPAPEAAPEPTAAGTTDQAPEEAQTANQGTPTEQTPPQQPEQPPAPKPDAKPETAYTKAQKEQQRLGKTWEQVNRDKELVRQQAAENQRVAAELAAQAAALRQMQQPQPQQPAAEPPHAAESTWTPERWNALAAKLEADGKYDLADAAREEAKKAPTGPRPAHAQAPAQPVAPPAPAPMIPGSQAFNAAWQQTTTELLTLDPDLGKADSPIRLATAEALRTNPEFSRRPNGIAYAYHQALRGIVANQQAELAKLKPELERLNKTNALRGSPPGAVTTTPKSIHDMTPAEADEYVLAQARAADRGDV